MSDRKAEITLIKDYCKSCSLCVNICPVKILEIDPNDINAKGYNPVRVIDRDKCIACQSCQLICPDLAILVERV